LSYAPRPADSFAYYKLVLIAQYSFNNEFPSDNIEMNVFELQQVNFLGYPQPAVLATNNTTKKVQNYVFRLN
jgi:hypothetical protein